jgi:penicillin-binding protein 1A
MAKTENTDFRILVRWFWYAVVAAPLSLILLLLLTWAGLFGSLPSTEEIANPKSYLATQIITSDGRQLGTFFTENRVHSDYGELPEHLVQALIATEDERFLNHGGIDFRALARAVVKLGRDGGGSTITQQLAKQMFHEPARGFKRLFQKPKEWIISMQLESRYSKEELIAMYFNQFDFLYQGVGIYNASNVYFGKMPAELHAEESAMLVGMCKNPWLYNPARAGREESALNRRNTVLNQMENSGFLTEEEADSLKALPVQIDFTPGGHDKGLAPYLREHIRQYMKEWVTTHPKPDGSEYNLYTDGLKIYTTIDSRVQRAAEEAVEQHMTQLQKAFFRQIKGRAAGPFYFDQGNSVAGANQILSKAMKQTPRWQSLRDAGMSEAAALSEFKKPLDMKVFAWGGDRDTLMSPWDSIKYMKSIYQVGLLSVEPQTGFIKAWVGGVDFKHFKYDAVRQGRRQVGSTFKPFVYAAAIADKKYSPCMQVPNIQTCIEAGQYGLAESWCPSNSDNKYGGVLNLKQALAGSVNTITAYLMKQVGPAPIAQLAQNLGVKSDIPVVPSIALGTVDMSVFELVGAYTAFGNQGLYTEPIVMLRIEDANGVVLDEFGPTTREVFSPEVAYTMASLLQGVTQFGTGARLRYGGGGYPDGVATGFPYSFDMPIAGKTGTTQNNSDGWFIGMVPNLVTGVWTGCQDRSAHFGSTTYGQGASTALPIWALFMRRLYADPKIGIRRDAFDRPLLPMTIALDCGTLQSDQAEAREESSEFD